MLKPEARHLLADGLKSHRIDIVCLRETTIAGDTTEPIQDSSGEPSYKMFASGYEKQGVHGVAICIHSRLTNNVMEWKACGPRLCYMRLHAVPVAISFICTYSQLKTAVNQTRNNSLQNYKIDSKTCLEKTFLIIAGDFNAK